jgi:hypothetical protein
MRAISSPGHRVDCACQFVSRKVRNNNFKLGSFTNHIVTLLIPDQCRLFSRPVVHQLSSIRDHIGATHWRHSCNGRWRCWYEAVVWLRRFENLGRLRGRNDLRVWWWWRVEKVSDVPRLYEKSEGVLRFQARLEAEHAPISQLVC